MSPRSAILLASVVWCLGHARAGAGEARPLGLPWEQDDSFRIEWKGAWAATVEANLPRWRKELEASVKDHGRRERLGALRTMKLCAAAIERFGQDADERIAIYGAMADTLDRLGSHGAANDWRKRTIAEFPGRLDVAVAALTRILEATSHDTREIEEGEDWVEYAVGRLLALHGAGSEKGTIYFSAAAKLNVPFSGLQAAWRARFEQAMRRRRYWEAAHALDEMAAQGFRPQEIQAARAEMFFQAGRVRDAAALFADLAAEAEDEHARGRLRQLERLASDPPGFLTSSRAEAALEQLQARGAEADPVTLQFILDRAASEEALVPWERGRFTSLWAAVDRHALAKGVLPEVRAAQQRAADRKKGTIYFSASEKLNVPFFLDAQVVFAAYRRWPWAQAVHAALVVTGERALREGQLGVAARCFRDVASHAAAPDLRAYAAKGLKLATEPRAGQLETRNSKLETLGVPPVAPWLRDPLIGPDDESRWWIPPAAASTTAAEGKLLYAGPNVLACYSQDLSRPLWWRTPRGPWPGDDEERPGRQFTIAAGSIVPALADGRVYSRWGLDGSRQCPTSLAAFDAATGEMLWSTAGDPTLRDLWPVGNPAVSDGRVYSLAGSSRPTTLRAFHLVCLDAERGTLLWRRFLCSAGAALQVGDGAPPVPRDQVDVATHGGWVAVRGGAVFCMPSAGFVARCDARDGLVEWARSYPSVRPGANLEGVLRRQGAPPVVAGNAVVFLPRDSTGAFALDGETGRVLWEAPFVPSDGAAGALGGNALLHDGRWVASVESATGNVAWARCFEEGMAARPALHGSELSVATAKRLVRLDAATGVAVESAPWQGETNVACLLPIGDALVAIADMGAVPGDEAPSLSPPAAGPAGPALPLQRAWHLPRLGLDLELPPPGAKLGDRLYLRSEGLLECLAADARGASSIAWQRTVGRERLAIGWANGAMLLIGSEGGTGFQPVTHGQDARATATCLDAATGARRWTTGLPFTSREWAVCGPYLFVGNLRDGRHCAMLRLDTGATLWQSRFLDALGDEFRGAFDGFGWDGERLHFFMAELGGSDRLPAELLVQPSDGAIVALRRFPDGKERWPQRLALAEGYAFGISRERFAFSYALRDGAMTRHQAEAGSLDPQRVEALAVTAPWVQVRWRRGPGDQPPRTLVLRLGDPAYGLVCDLRGRIVGDTLYEAAAQSHALRALNLATRKEVIAYAVPGPRGPQDRILDFAEAGDAVWVASSSGQPAEQRVRVDLFERASGRHLGGQELAEVALPRVQLAWAKGTLLVADAAGLHAFVPMPPDTRPARSFHVALRTEQAPSLGGRADTWEAATTFPLRGEPPASLGPSAALSGTLRVAHDDKNLYLAVRRRDSAPMPRIGSGCADGGDMLDIALIASGGAYRWILGLDQRGRAAVTPAVPPFGSPQGRPALPDGMRVAVRQDVLGGETSYELAIPKDALARSEGRKPQRLGLALAAWDDAPSGPGHGRPGGSGPRRVLTFGDVQDGPHGRRPGIETIHLDTQTQEQAAAAGAIARELPDLPASRALLDRGCTLRADDPQELAEFCWDALLGKGDIQLFATKSRLSPFPSQAIPLLRRIAEALRKQGNENPLPEILRRAARLGVPESVLRRFELQATSYLSQWVYVAEGAPPQTLMVELSDGSGSPSEWAHRAFWGKAPWHWDPRILWLDRREEVPQKQWTEMRIPLHAVGMDDEPVCGISFFQQGGPRVTWDRTVLVAGGKEAVAIADSPPRGFLRGDWEWLEKGDIQLFAPKSRLSPFPSRAHTGPPPPGPQAIRMQAVDLERPVVAHLDPPLDAPYLSQWVFLDPAKPPEMVSLDLHDGSGWSFAAIWGAKKRYGRYIGPLPPPGQWHELRLPLAWTPFAARTIAGIAFGHFGGRAVWDRTAIVAGAKEQVLIEDEAPPLLPPADRLLPTAEPSTSLGPGPSWLGWLHPGRFHYVGGTEPVAGKLGAGCHFDGHTGYIEVPHADALDPATLTVEAWVRFDLFPSPGDTRRWIVNKNRNERADGHYGLIVSGDEVGAYINIGGDRGRYQAGSPSHTLQLHRWHHIAMTYDGDTLRVYANGAEVASEPVRKPRTPGTQSLQIARRQDGSALFHGDVDEVRLYNRALSAEEMKARFASGGAPPQAAAAQAVVAHWGFDADALPAAPAAQWQWVEQPVKSGRKAHTDAASTGFAAHCAAPLAVPFTQHLPFDLARASAVLKANIPRLGTSDMAWDFFEDLLQLQTVSAPRADLCRWFLTALPGHPAEGDALGTLWRTCFDAGDPDATRTVDAFLREHPASPQALHGYRRSQACRVLSPEKVWPYLVEPFLALKTAKPLPADWGPGAVDLLKLADPAADAAEGDWQKLDGQLVSASHRSNARLGLPVAPQGSYQLEVQFTRVDGDCVALMLPVGTTGVTLILGGWNGRISGLAFLNGKDANANETTRDGRFTDGEKHTVVVQVQLLERNQAELSVALDDKPYIKWRGALAALSPDPAWGLRRRDVVGLGAYDAIVVFHNCQLRR